MITVIARSAWRAMPWKNGGGVAHDIVAEPPEAGYDSFIWRLSAAEVTRDGPFSLFPDIDRTMAILSGEGLELTGVLGEPMVLRCQTAPFAFPGDVAVTARLIGGPVTNMNLMSRRTEVTQAMHRVTLTGRLDLAADPVTLVHLERGRASLEDADGAVELHAGDTAVLRQPAALTGQKARVLVMEISARR
jgi:uncharacterized protein